nr:hypothetical protein K4M19_00014 [Agrobacterium fabrum]
MESLIVIINLSGAVALLLFGLAQVKDGASRALGSKLRTSLATGTKSSVRSFLTGFVATVALQSSTATALMVSSFVERELIKPRMAQVVLLGANVGTAVTAWIVATGIEWISPFLLVVGIVLYRGGSTSRQGAGTAMIGIALMLLSLHLLSAATEPLRHSQALGAFIRAARRRVACRDDLSRSDRICVILKPCRGRPHSVIGYDRPSVWWPCCRSGSGGQSGRRDPASDCCSVGAGSLQTRHVGQSHRSGDRLRAHSACGRHFGRLAFDVAPPPTPSYQSMRIWPSTSLWRFWPGHFPNSSRVG